MLSFRDFRPSRRFQPSLSLSSDGSRIAYADDALGQYNLTVQGLAGDEAEILTRYTDNTVRRVAWHPEGESLVFVADARGNENSQIYRIGLDGGDPELLTGVPSARYTAALGNPFSPDGRYLAYVGTDRNPADQDVLIRDLTTGEERRVYTGGGRVYAGNWSPDGHLLTAAQWVEGNSDHIVLLVPADGSSTRRLTPEGDAATYWLGPWLPDGSGFLVMSNAGREYTGLAVMSAVSGEMTWLDADDRDVEGLALSGDGRRLVWMINVDGANQLRGRDLTTGIDFDLPQLPLGEADALTISSDGRLVAMLFATSSMPWNVVVLDVDSGEMRWLTDATPTSADSSSFVEPSLVHFPSRTGEQIPAYLYRPATSVQPVGVVVSIHGGPVYQERPGYVQDGLYQYLLSRGIAVLAPNIHGSSGYGKSYTQRIYRDWGGVDLDDFAGMAAFLRSLEGIDADRIGLFGGSYGGFAVLSCISRLHEVNWAAAVDIFGISNLVTLAKASPPTWRSLVSAVIGDPDDDHDSLMARSPVTHADNIRTPLFVIQGANDPRVPQSESDQIVDRLRARGVDVRYDIYPDEGHGFTKAENQIKAFSDAAEFLVSRLAATTPVEDSSAAADSEPSSARSA